MAKLTLDTVTGGYNLSVINSNFDKIEAALENTVSRDGTLPNSMGAVIDMNGNNIINAASVSTQSLSINGAPVVANQTFVTPLPSPSGQSGKILQSDGNTAFWSTDTPADLRSDLSDVSQGDALVGIKLNATGSVSRTQDSKNAETVSVKDFGAEGNGVTDDTVAINTAITSSIAASKILFFPAGTYITSNIAAQLGMKLLGEGPEKTIIKLKNGANGGLVTSSSTNIDDVHIEGIQFDGNNANNTLGDVLAIRGARPSIINVCIKNAPENGIVTDRNLLNGERTFGCEGFFSHITIDSTQKSGWVHYGPSDSHFESVIIIDAGLKTNNAYYGMFLSLGPGNGRFFNLHVWNRDTTTNVPASAVYVESSGNNFSGCHFEGGNVALTVTGAANTFASCAAYAPRRTFSVNLVGSSNSLSLALGLTYPTANPSYKGVNLAGSNNILHLINAGSGCILGAVDFTSDPGQNIIRLTGNQATGSAYVGTPHSSSEVAIAVSGAAGAVLFKEPEIAWAAFTPTVTSGTGSLTTASGAGRYYKKGKTVVFSVTATITTNGTGAGNITITLPVNANTALGGQTVCGRERGLTGKAVAAAISSANMQVFFYDNTYPGANGAIISINGSYEAA